MIYKDKLLINTPIISVCVPTFNQEQYISETLESILSQEIDVPYEILIADDCSTDSTLQICLDYQLKYPEKIFIIANEINRGILENYFDVLIHNARGEYIAICAGDDIWISQNKLKAQYELLKSNLDVSVVHTGYNNFFEKTNKYIPTNKHWISPLTRIYGKEAVKEALLEHFSFFPLASSLMYRKSTVDKYSIKYSNLIHDKNSPGEGLILFSFFALDGVFELIPDIMVNYRIREESLCHIIDKDKELIFRIKYRIFQKTLISTTILDDVDFTRRVNRTFLILFMDSINNSSEKVFFELYNSYKEINDSNIPGYVKFLISFVSHNSFNKYIFKSVFSILLNTRAKFILSN